MKRLLNQYSLLLIIGVPVILLLLSLILSFKANNNLEGAVNEYNSYTKSLPLNYSKLIGEQSKNDSTFFFSAFESFGIREIVIFKAFPNSQDVIADFKINIQSSNKFLKNSLELTHSNDAALYNYNGITYGVYRSAIPFIDIEKISIERKVLNKYQKKWNASIEMPFNKGEINTIATQTNGERRLPNPYLSIFSGELKYYNISFLPYSYTVLNDSLFQSQSTLKKYVNEKGITGISVEGPKSFFDLINKKKPVKSRIKFYGDSSDHLEQLITDFENQNIALDAVFDLDKTAKYFAIKDTYSSRCDELQYFIFNSESNLLEPIFVNSNCLGKMSDFMTKPLIDNPNYIEVYINTLDEISKRNIYEDLILTNSSFEEELRSINYYYPKNIFDLDILKINQRIIQKNLITETAIKSELISINDKKIVFSVINLSNYPIIINGLHHKKKVITSLNPRPKIKSGTRDTIEIELPRSFENLFVSKKNKAAGFILHKHIYDLSISYSTLGVDKNLLSSIIPYTENKEINDDLFRDASLVNNHENIIVDNLKRIITFSEKEIKISSALVIPEGYTFEINPGTNIDILKGGKIISQSPLKLIGTKQQPIKIFSSDKMGQGMLVLSDGKPSNLNFVEFDALANPIHGHWSVTGAITFYESPAKLNNVTISNNRCEDALNIIRSSFTMKNCQITDTQSDAFDGDFVEGTIINCQFSNLGNDAIDISGSNLIIKDVKISNAQDKGLSAGEDSKMTIENVEIIDSEIGIAGKDLSIVNAKFLKIINTKLGLTAFQKKSEFGPSNITVNGITIENVETNYLIESSSNLLVDGKKIETSQNVKDRMYGVEFGRSSAETRISQ